MTSLNNEGVSHYETPKDEETGATVLAAYCLGAQPATRLKAVLKALSDW